MTSPSSSQVPALPHTPLLHVPQVPPHPSSPHVRAPQEATQVGFFTGGLSSTRPLQAANSQTIGGSANVSIRRMVNLEAKHEPPIYPLDSRSGISWETTES